MLLYLLVITVILSVGTSAFCSVMEAALYAVPLAHVKYLADSGSSSGKILLDFKENISRPIAAILILNTIANTAGAAVAGGVVVELYGEPGVAVFSVVFTLMILYFSEITPKQIGVSYCRLIAPLMTYPLLFFTRVFAPLVAVSEFVSKLLSKGSQEQKVSQEEVVSMAQLGTEEGVLDRLEGSVIRNVIGLDRLTPHDILTPRVVVSRLDESMQVGEVLETISGWEHSRVPLYVECEPDMVTHYVLQRDIYRALLEGDKSRLLKEFARELKVIPEYMRLDKLIVEMFRDGEHICSVIDEHGGFAGIVTLEDIIEEVVGREIVDEYDKVKDLRSYAKTLHSQKQKRRESEES